MIGYRFSVILATCLTFLGITSKLSFAFQEVHGHAEIILIAQTPPILKVGSQGENVTELQQKLQQLGFFDQDVNGIYGDTTKAAVTEFQKSIGLEADGIMGQQTWTQLQTQVESSSESEPPASDTSDSEAGSQDSDNQSTDQESSPNLMWLMLGVGGIGIVFVSGLFFVLRADPTKSANLSPSQETKPKEKLKSTPTPQKPKFPVPKTNKVVNLPTLSPPESFPHHPTSMGAGVHPSQNSSEQSVPVEQTTRLAKVDIIDELIKDLSKSDRKQRRKAIWELAQRADSRAVQPLVDCIINSDSQERGLILEALSQIGTRTLKPMNSALAISLRDENPEVRKNAIRDLTRMYEMISSMGQLLSHAVDDPDTEVQETAKWAMKQLNQIQMSVKPTHHLPMEKEQ